MTRYSLGAVASRFMARFIMAGAAFALVLFPSPDIFAKDFPPAVQKLIGPANSEGVVHVSWGATFGGSSGAKVFEKGFNAHYGTSVKFKFTVGRSWPAHARKLGQELAGGQPAFMDIALLGGTDAPYYLQKKILMPNDWSQLAPQIPAKTRKLITSPGGEVVNYYSRIFTIEYNPKIVPANEVPRKLTDLLNPKWKGRVATTPFALATGRLALHPEWGEKRVLDFVRALAGNIGGLVRCAEHDRITSGEFPIFGLACEPGTIQKRIDKGHALAQIIPLDALVIDHVYLGVPRHAAHKNIATLFLAWMLTSDGQDLTYKLQGSDSYYRKGSRRAKDFEAVGRRAGKPVMDQTLGLLLANAKQIRKVRRAAGKILRETKKKEEVKG